MGASIITAGVSLEKNPYAKRRGWIGGCPYLLSLSKDNKYKI
jgi:hypothetical protein